MIKEIIIKGKEVHVHYESEIWKCYMKLKDIPDNMKGIYPLPKKVIKFMQENPNKVR